MSDPNPNRLLAYRDLRPVVEQLLAASPDRLVWGSDWPHPNIDVPMPNDGDLLDALPGWIDDPALIRKILVDNPAKLHRFPAWETEPARSA